MADCCILFTTTLQKQNAAPRFPLQSFCRYCFVPAVFFRFRFKNRACFIQASKRIPLQSLSVSTLPYTCTHLPHTAVTGYGRNNFIILSPFRKPFFNCHIFCIYRKYFHKLRFIYIIGIIKSDPINSHRVF